MEIRALSLSEATYIIRRLFDNGPEGGINEANISVTDFTASL